MLDFSRYVPYHINQEILKGLILKPVPGPNGKAENKTAVSVLDVLQSISACGGDFEILRSGPILEIRIGGSSFSFDTLSDDEASQVLELSLEANKKAGKWGEGFYCAWYFYEQDSEIDYPHVFYKFFLCKGDAIIDPSVSISDGSFRFPKNFLIKDEKTFFWKEAGKRAALARICYQKWKTETYHGRIFAMEERI